MRPDALRICLVASSRHPIGEPLAGGLEAHTYFLARELRRRGHQVTLFAAPGSDPALGVETLDVLRFRSSETAARDVSAWPVEWLAEHHAYLGLMLELGRTGSRRFDVVHNNSLHHLPLAMSGAVAVPVVTTLHTPPVPWLESAMAYAAASSVYVAVSETTARAWSHVVTAEVILNGVDAAAWPVGPGGGPAVWSGRIVAEKGTHLAVRAARASGRELLLAGQLHDRDYFVREIEPLLGSAIRYVGHLDQTRLADLVGRAAVALVTPCWEEPYGLVVAEAMHTGTPVAALARGALPELVDESVGALGVPTGPDDGPRGTDERASVAALSAAWDRAVTRDRRDVRAFALDRFSLSRMVDQYEALYRSVRTAPQAAA